ncbi:c-type cytochrome biogenesis protein CcmI [Stappia sp. F7233]|uniref:C-type cytochrome biogenesis protein CcmI n=2 Tax=Stappia albiluteola TaxID=2758565 RepID=A0A839ACI8_9HYPH|nr:c-type cytochrome biogenesis protein CcmI [Stappia albiluteola]
MMIWIAFALLTALAALSVLVPMARARKETVSPAANDAEVYRAQLHEVERDLERGLIDAEQAEGARTEIARRLIAAGRAGSSQESGEAKGETSLRFARLAAIAMLPLAAVGLYLELGSPDIPDQPLAARIAAADANTDINLLVAQVERHLAENPQDGRGWEVLAPVYMRLGRTTDAVNAYRSAIRLLGSDARRETDFGEALTIANQGLVSAEARVAFEKAVAADPKAAKPRFFLAIALGQEGKTQEAIAAWQALLADAEGNEPWVEVALSELKKIGGEPPAAASAPGPSVEDVEAAGAMSDEERAQMIGEMVARLDERLARDGGSAEEWMRLIRAYQVLGEKDKTAASVKRAAAALRDDPAASEALRSLAQEIGVPL